MATQLRRIPTGADNTTVKFLFSVIRQLETKHVLWQTVANENGITNGHAARMRFSRLKAQVEGTAPYGRADKGDGSPRKARKMDVRTERKLEAARIQALKEAGIKVETGGEMMPEGRLGNAVAIKKEMVDERRVEGAGCLHDAGVQDQRGFDFNAGFGGAGDMAGHPSGGGLVGGIVANKSDTTAFASQELAVAGGVQEMIIKNEPGPW